MILTTIFYALLALFIYIVLYRAIILVNQSDVAVIERLGKYSRTCEAGLHVIVPFLDRPLSRNGKKRISILEQQIDVGFISVITKDNVEVDLETVVFFKTVDAAKSVYRIADVRQGMINAATSIVRSAGGKLELDELQSSREKMNKEIADNLTAAAEIWGVEITRTEIVDIKIDDATKEAQRQQLNAERTRRATIAAAEGEKTSIQLKADATLYEAQKEAEAVRIAAEAEAYSIKIKAEADAEQTTLLAKAIASNGKPAVDFEIAKRQVKAIGELATSNNAKTFVLPSEMTQVFSAAYSFLDSLPSKKDSK